MKIGQTKMVANQQEISEIRASTQTVSWGALIYTALGPDGYGMRFSGVTSAPLDRTWMALRKEVLELLGPGSAKYRTERSALPDTVQPALAALAMFLMSRYGYPAAAACSLAGLALALFLAPEENGWQPRARSTSVRDSDRMALRALLREMDGEPAWRPSATVAAFRCAATDWQFR